MPRPSDGPRRPRRPGERTPNVARPQGSGNKGKASAAGAAKEDGRRAPTRQGTRPAERVDRGAARPRADTGTADRAAPLRPPPARAKPARAKPAPRKPAQVRIATTRDDGLHRIAKLLARAGVASRREIERMIAEGRVAVGGEVITTPATLLADLSTVTVDGQPVGALAEPLLYLFHKPAGVLTAERDFSGRPTIYSVLPEGLPRLMPVGRLDLNTEGLLLLTNDGALKRALELPSSGIERTYRARTFGTVTQEQLDMLAEGISVEGVRYGRIIANLERSTGRNRWIELTLTEGKNREVRRVLEHLGLKVSRLIRTRYGPFTLGIAPEGAVERAAPRDFERLMRDLKLG